MDETIQTYEVVWQDIPVTITFRPKWLSLTGHLELKSEQRLPVTETGYRSLFLSEESIERAGGAIAFVLGLLDEAAESQEWKDHCDQQQQLSLF